MTISTELRKAGPFTGNGVTTAFPFSFKVFAATDVTVTRADTLGAETGLVLNADFTVALNADQDAAPGGTVTLAAPLSTGYRLVVSSAVPNLQPTDITNNGGFYPRVIEDALDRHVAQIQQIDEKVGRALKVAVTSPLGDLALPSPVAGMLIGWNESNDGLKNYAPIGGTLLGQQLAAANGSSLVGFQQAGTGAVVRTAQDKMRERVSARDFGAANELYSGLRGINSGGLPSGTVIDIAGGASIGDGAGGAFVLDATDTVSADNGGTILVDASGGRWKREFAGNVQLVWFGAVGNKIADDTAPIQLALNYCRDTAQILDFYAGAEYRTTAPLIIEVPAQTRMNGAIIVPDAVGFTGAEAVRIDGLSYLTVNADMITLEVSVQGPYGGFAYSRPPKLPTASYSNLDGVRIQATHQLSNLNLKLWVEGFRDGVVVAGGNWWLLRFLYPNIGKCWRRGWSFSRTVNAGEMIYVQGGVTYNCVNAGADGASEGTAVAVHEDGTTNLDAAWIGHSIDYCDISMDVATGVWNMVSCHLENANNNPHAIVRKTSARAPTQLNFYGSAPSSGPGGSAWSAAETAGGRPHFIETIGEVSVAVREAQLFSYGNTNTKMVHPSSGTPRHVHVSGWMDTIRGQRQPTPFAGANLIYNGNAETGNLNGWTEEGSSGSAWSVDSASPISGTRSFKIVASGNSTTQYQEHRCISGETILVKCRVKLESVASGSLQIRVKFYDWTGAVLIQDDVGTAGIFSTVGEGHLGSYYKVPVGATKARVHMYANGLNGTGYFDEFEMYRIG